MKLRRRVSDAGTLQTFGQRLRAARLRWAPAFGGWMRCRMVSRTELLVEWHPEGLVPSHAANQQFICWWESPDFIPRLTSHLGYTPVRIKKRASFVIDVEKDGAK